MMSYLGYGADLFLGRCKACFPISTKKSSKTWFERRKEMLEGPLMHVWR